MGFAKKTARQMTGRSPGADEGGLCTKVFTIYLKEMCIFSAGLIFETVLLGVRNKMKKVLDELYVIGLYKH